MKGITGQKETQTEKDGRRDRERQTKEEEREIIRRRKRNYA